MNLINFNRTNMELKPRVAGWSDEKIKNFNRTNMELKRAYGSLG